MPRQVSQETVGSRTESSSWVTGFGVNHGGRHGTGLWLDNFATLAQNISGLLAHHTEPVRVPETREVCKLQGHAGFGGSLRISKPLLP